MCGIFFSLIQNTDVSSWDFFKQNKNRIKLFFISSYLEFGHWIPNKLWFVKVAELTHDSQALS